MQASQMDKLFSGCGLSIPHSVFTAAVSQIEVLIAEDLLPLGRRESEAISGYAELEEHCQRQKRPARVNQVG